jgi:hypothetical protein
MSLVRKLHRAIVAVAYLVQPLSLMCVLCPSGLGNDGIALGGLLCSLVPSGIPVVIPDGSLPAGFGPRSRWSRHRRCCLCLCGMMGSSCPTPVVWPLGPGDIAHSPRSSERLFPLLLNTHPPERRFSSPSFTQPFHDAANQRSDQRTESHIYT